MTRPLGYDDALTLAQRAIQLPNVEAAADHYKRLAEDRDEEIRLLSNARRFPHYEIHQERDGVHIIYEDADPIRGITHTDHVEPSWRAAWIWAERHHRVLEGTR